MLLIHVLSRASHSSLCCKTEDRNVDMSAVPGSRAGMSRGTRVLSRSQISLGNVYSPVFLWTHGTTDGVRLFQAF